MHSHAEKVVFSYNLQRGKLASFWRNLAFVTTTASNVSTIGKRKTQKKRRRKTKSMPKAVKCLHCHAEKVVFSYNLQRGKLASFWRNLAFVTTTASKVYTIGKRKTQKRRRKTKSLTKAGKCLYSHAEKVVFSYNLQKGHKLAGFWRNLDFVTATAGKVHAIGKRKNAKKDGANAVFPLPFQCKQKRARSATLHLQTVFNFVTNSV